MLTWPHFQKPLWESCMSDGKGRQSQWIHLMLWYPERKNTNLYWYSENTKRQGWNTGLLSSKIPFTAMANVHILFLRYVINIDVWIYWEPQSVRQLFKKKKKTFSKARYQFHLYGRTRKNEKCANLNLCVCGLIYLPACVWGWGIVWPCVWY